MIGLGMGLSRGSGGHSFRPDNLPGLAVWLNAQKLNLSNNDPVQTWPDLSGNAYSPTQPTLTKRPTFKTSGINGMPALQFDGVDDWLSTTSIPLLRQVAGCSIFNVFQNVANPPLSGRLMAVLTPSSSFRVGINVRGVTVHDECGGRRLDTDPYQGATANNPGYVSTPKILRLLVNWSARTLGQWTNGVLINFLPGFQTAGLSANTDSTLAINGDTAPSSLLHAECIIYNRLLSNEEAARVEGYLSRKYSISL